MNDSFKILVVDDDQDTADSLGELLGLWGYECKTAYDGFAAMDTAKEFLPDIIVLDIGLPEMNGYQVAVQMRKDFGLDGTKLVAVTGYIGSTYRQTALDSGFDEVIGKPANLTEFKALISQFATKDTLKSAKAGNYQGT